MQVSKTLIITLSIFLAAGAITLALTHLNPLQNSCQYNGNTYKNGQGFKSIDGCNTCSCAKGQVACTLMACSPNIAASYNCDNKKTINANFIVGEPKPVAPGEMPSPTGSVNLKLSDGRSMTLNQTVSADGGRYATRDETTLFWDKGGTAFLEEHGKITYQNCVAVK